MKIEKIIQLLDSGQREDILLAYEYLLHEWGSLTLINSVLEEHNRTISISSGLIHVGYNSSFSIPAKTYLASEWRSFVLNN